MTFIAPLRLTQSVLLFTSVALTAVLVLSAALAAPGDPTGDGEIQSNDIICVAKATVGLDLTGTPCANDLDALDVNCDGELEANDIILTARLVVGLTLSAEMDANANGICDACEPCQSIPWKGIGPGGGGAWRNIAIHPTNPDIVLAGSDVTGVYKTDSGGADWTLAKGFAKPDFTQAAVSTWGLIFADENTVYHCSPVGIMRSDDAGSSFVHKPWGEDLGGKYSLYGGSSCSAITADPDNPQKLWSGSGIPRQAMNLGFVDSVWAQNRVWRTTDGFDTVTSAKLDADLDYGWDPQDPRPTPHVFLVDRSTPVNNRRLLSHSVDQLFESVDDGVSWTQKESVWTAASGSTFTTPQTGIRTMVIAHGTLDTAADDVIYALLVNTVNEATDPTTNNTYADVANWQGGVYRSLDWGKTWNEWNGKNGPNLLVDGGFEGQTLQDSGWQEYVSNGALGAAVTLTAGAARTGKQGIHIQNGTVGSQATGVKLAENIAVKPLQRYALQMWVRQSTSAALLGRFYFYDDKGEVLEACAGYGADPLTQYETAVSSKIQTGEWRLLRGEVRAPPGAATATIRLYTWNGTEGSVDVDDVEVHASKRLPWSKQGSDLPAYVSTTFSEFNHIVMHPNDPNQLYVTAVGCHNWDGVWGSTDGGVSWEHLSRRGADCAANLDGPFRHRSIDWTPNDTIDWALGVGGSVDNPTIVFGTRYYLVRSDDGGKTWIQNDSHAKEDGTIVGHGEINNTFISTLTFHPTVPQTFYYGDADNMMLWTDNDAESWHFEGVKMPGIDPFPGFHSWDGGDVANSIVVDPADSDVLWLSAIGRSVWHFEPPFGSLIRYDMGAEGGPTFEEIADDGSYPTGGPVDLSIDPDSPAEMRTFYAASWMHGVYKSVNNGITWTSLGADGSYPGWSPAPTHDGATRLRRHNPTGRLIAGFGDNQMQAGYTGGLWLSDDDGVTWTGLGGDTFNHVEIEDLVYQSATQILVAANEGPNKAQGQAGVGQGGVWRGVEETSGNWEWTQVLARPMGSSVVISPHDSNVIYAAASHIYFHAENQFAGIYRSDDAGATWTYLESPGLNFISWMRLYLSPHDPSKIYVGTFGGGVYEGTIPVGCQTSSP